LWGRTEPTENAPLVFLRQNWQTLVNVFLFFVLGEFALRKAVQAWHSGGFDVVEVTFALKNIIVLTFLLIRQNHVDIEGKFFPQVIALVAFFSGLGFVQSSSALAISLSWAKWVILASMIVGIFAALSLGRSFGILIAVRKVKTGGVYRLVRHPMYFSDILIRIGYILKNSCWINIVLFVFSTTCYMYRAVLEERFLSQTPEYRSYMQQVRYRLIPGIF